MQLTTDRDTRIPERKLLAGGHEVWLWEDGTCLPVIRGGDGDDPDENDDENEEDEDDDKSPKPNSAGKFTQDDLKRVGSKEKKAGKVAGRREVLKELGVETEEELKDIVTKHRTAQDSAKSEAEKQRDQATKDRSEADKERAEARREKNVTKCERALLRADCPDDQIGRVTKLLEIDLNDDLEMDDIKDAVTELKKEMPQLFVVKESGEEDEESDSKKQPSSDPGKRRKPTGDKKSNADAASEMMARRHPKPVSTGTQGGT